MCCLLLMTSPTSWPLRNHVYHWECDGWFSAGNGLRKEWRASAAAGYRGGLTLVQAPSVTPDTATLVACDDLAASSACAAASSVPGQPQQQQQPRQWPQQLRQGQDEELTQQQHQTTMATAEYTLRLWSGGAFSGTRPDVWLELAGSHGTCSYALPPGSSSCAQLSSSGHDESVFCLVLPDTIGPLKALSVWSEPPVAASMSAEGTAWFLSRVEVAHAARRQRWMFAFDVWIARGRRPTVTAEAQLITNGAAAHVPNAQSAPSSEAGLGEAAVAGPWRPWG